MRISDSLLCAVAILLVSHPTKLAPSPVKLAPTTTTSVTKACAVSRHNSVCDARLYNGFIITADKSGSLPVVQSVSILGLILAAVSTITTQL